MSLMRYPHENKNKKKQEKKPVKTVNGRGKSEILENYVIQAIDKRTEHNYNSVLKKHNTVNNTLTIRILYIHLNYTRVKEARYTIYLLSKCEFRDHTR